MQDPEKMAVIIGDAELDSSRYGALEVESSGGHQTKQLSDSATRFAAGDNIVAIAAAVQTNNRQMNFFFRNDRQHRSVSFLRQVFFAASYCAHDDGGDLEVSVMTTTTTATLTSAILESSILDLIKLPSCALKQRTTKEASRPVGSVKVR